MHLHMVVVFLFINYNSEVVHAYLLLVRNRHFPTLRPFLRLQARIK